MKAIDWRDLAHAAYGNPWAEPPRPKIVIVTTRYDGCYEGGRFAAIPIDALDSDAFGDDCAAGDWWEAHRQTVGVGPTPSDALEDWFKKTGEKP